MGTQQQSDNDPAKQAATLPSSQGNSPVEMTPGDVTPEHASWRDRTPRKLNSEDIEEKVDALLDEASDLSFPASDPIAIPDCASKLSPPRACEEEKPEAEDKPGGQRPAD